MFINFEFLYKYENSDSSFCPCVKNVHHTNKHIMHDDADRQSTIVKLTYCDKYMDHHAFTIVRSIFKMMFYRLIEKRIL